MYRGKVLAQFESQQAHVGIAAEEWQPDPRKHNGSTPFIHHGGTASGGLRQNWGPCPERRVRVDDSQINYRDGRLFRVGIMGPWWFQDFKRPGMALNMQSSQASSMELPSAFTF
jgi:hypothetical protein